jgi:zinc protease
MRVMRFPFFLPALLLLLSACAQTGGSAQSSPRPPTTVTAAPDWAFQQSDVPLDPAYRFGKLDNGMRYVIRRNATPAGTATVRMEVGSGSLSENEDERGYAHFVEHMAFNGSTHVPEGEMVKLLEREGLAFGADTNAYTSFEQTHYRLDLPRNDAALLDTALMLMRETASELSFSEEAVARERGVVLAEKRDRNTYRLRELEEQLRFSVPDARYAHRLPIGTTEVLEAATGLSLRAFWQREYVPANTTVIVVGDYDPDQVEGAIRMHFADWRPAPAPAKPEAGPVDFKRKGLTDIYIDPALSERITVSRHGAWLDEKDTVATRQKQLLRRIGYEIVNRRLKRLARQANAPFRDAGFGTGDIFKAGRTTNLVIDAGDGEWRKALLAAALEYRRALTFGFTDAEVAEQITAIRTATQDAASGADTRSHDSYVSQALELLRDDKIPATPQNALERFEKFVPSITAHSVFSALQSEAVALKDPLIRFQGRKEVAGGADALRAAWNEAMAKPLVKAEATAASQFGYTDFGAPGTVVADNVRSDLGIRVIRFANGVRLNLKQTELEKDRVRVIVNLDGGQMLETPENPVATDMMSSLASGGLSKHSEDELDTILAGRSVGLSIRDTERTFEMSARTTPRDLELQLQLFAAAVTDPGYRLEGEQRYRRGISNYFARKDATPASALAAAIGGILSDGDPRFTLQTEQTYRDLTFDKLRNDISNRLAHGAIELALVGDFDEQAAIGMVARTFGALPAREPDFQTYKDRRDRPFSANRTQHIIYHTGEDDQAALRLVWPTHDDTDPVESLKLALLERVVRLELTDTLREKLGKAYSPSASSELSRTWRGYGTFTLAVSVDVAEVAATRAAIRETLAELRDKPLDQDILQRARQPLLESFDNALKSNGGWMALVEHAQSEPDRIDRYLAGKARLSAITAADIQALARQYLTVDGGMEVIALPRPKLTE